jgi:hypothetical protein
MCPTDFARNGQGGSSGLSDIDPISPISPATLTIAEQEAAWSFYRLLGARRWRFPATADRPEERLFGGLAG